jgi:hypothetical protein
MRVSLAELIEALGRHTRMKRGPAGSTSTGLREAAFIPALGGMRVQMPGGSHFVWAVEGELSEEVVFDPKSVMLVIKALKSHIEKQAEADVSSTASHLVIKCGGTTLSLLRKPKGRQKRSV